MSEVDIRNAVLRLVKKASAWDLANSEAQIVLRSVLSQAPGIKVRRSL